MYKRTAFLTTTLYSNHRSADWSYVATEPNRPAYPNANNNLTSTPQATRKSEMADSEFSAKWRNGGMDAEQAYTEDFFGQKIGIGLAAFSIDLECPGLHLDGVHAIASKGQSSGCTRTRTAQCFSLPAAYDTNFNDSHSTHVGGAITAARDGDIMHEIAPNASIYVAVTDDSYDKICAADTGDEQFSKVYGYLAANEVPSKTPVGVVHQNRLPSQERRAFAI